MVTPPTLEGNGDTMIRARLEGMYIQMHRKSGSYKIHPEVSEKTIENTTLHNPFTTAMTCKAKVG